MARIFTRPQLRGAALVSVLVSFGCSHFGKSQNTQLPPPTPVAETEDDENFFYALLGIKEKKTPKPETCAGLADLRVQNAAKPDCPPEDARRLRDEARRAYQQAIKLDPEYLPPYSGLARLYEQTDQPDKAVETYRKGLKSLPKEASLWYELGMCQARRKQWDAALSSLKKATELEPENAGYSNAMGFTLARAGRFDESFAFFHKKLGEARAHYNVACMLHHVNRDEESKDHLRQALMAKPDLQPAQQLLAQLQNPNRGAHPIQPAGFSTTENSANR